MRPDSWVGRLFCCSWGGLILLLLELFVIPGFGAAGILGILGLMGSIVLAFGDLQTALINLSIVLVITILAVVLLWKRITQSRFWKRIVLSHSETPQAGYRAPVDLSHLVGKQGGGHYSAAPRWDLCD